MNIKINTDHLSSDIQVMKNNLDELENAKTQMYACLENLSSMWDGPAHTAFFMQTTLDRLVFVGLKNNLNNLVECMEYASSQYEKCRQEVNQKISGIHLSGDS